MKKVCLSTLALIFSVLSLTAQAQMKYIENRDYAPLPTVIDDAQAPKVIEFFWYGCGHCSNMYPVVHQWLDNDKPENLEFELVPAMPSSRWAMGGHLFYTAKALDMNIDAAVFEQVHSKNNPGIIFDEGKAKSFLVSQGADKAAVDKAWDSFAVKQNIERAKRLFEQSGMDGVPAFTVNGQYEVRYDGDDARFFDILDYVANLKN